MTRLDFKAINAYLNRRWKLPTPTDIMLWVVAFILVMWPWPKVTDDHD